MGHLLDNLHLENKSACKRSVVAALAEIIPIASRRCHALGYLVLRTQMTGKEGARMLAARFTADMMATLESLTADCRGVAVTLWSGYMLMYSQNVLPVDFEPHVALYFARHHEGLSEKLSSCGDTRTLYGGLGVLLLILNRNEQAKTLVLQRFPDDSLLWKNIRGLSHPTLNRYLDQLFL